MTLLSHDELSDAIYAESLESRLVIMPMLDPDDQIGPASVDLRLGTQFFYVDRIEDAGIDAGDDLRNMIEARQHRVTVDFGSPLWLHPGQLSLERP